MLKRNFLMVITSCMIPCALLASEGERKPLQSTPHHDEWRKRAQNCIRHEEIAFYKSMPCMPKKTKPQQKTAAKHGHDHKPTTSHSTTPPQRWDDIYVAIHRETLTPLTTIKHLRPRAPHHEIPSPTTPERTHDNDRDHLSNLLNRMLTYKYDDVRASSRSSMISTQCNTTTSDKSNTASFGVQPLQIVRGRKMKVLVPQLYGTSGLETLIKIKKIAKSLNTASKLQFDPSNKLFEMSDSTHISQEALKQALGAGYAAWMPQVANNRSPRGNLQISFICCPPEGWEHVQLDRSRFVWGGYAGF
jgi:hypothetical protein